MLFCDMAPYGLVERCQLGRGTCCHCVQRRRWRGVDGAVTCRGCSDSKLYHTAAVTSWGWPNELCHGILILRLT